MIDLTLSTKLFAALFAIMGPISVIPIFLAVTTDFTPAARRSTLITMLVTVTSGALICALAGHMVLSSFGIDVAHFRLAGGLIVLLIALSMLSGNEHASHAGTNEEQSDFGARTQIGVYPLGLPLTLGPGTMATIIVYAQAAREADELTAYYLGLVGYLIFFAGSMALAPWLGSRLSPTVLSVSKRLMGIILAAIAMEMMGGALSRMFPGLR